jgi:ankyrin repeat protein
LHIAAARGHEDIVFALLQQNAKPNMRNRKVLSEE